MPEYLKAKELSERLRVTSWTLYRWVRLGLIPVIRPRPNGKLLFDEAAVRAALDKAGQPVHQAGTPATPEPGILPPAGDTGPAHDDNQLLA